MNIFYNDSNIDNINKSGQGDYVLYSQNNFFYMDCIHTAVFNIVWYNFDSIYNIHIIVQLFSIYV